jgi:hypothetical protein
MSAVATPSAKKPQKRKSGRFKAAIDNQRLKRVGREERVARDLRIMEQMYERYRRQAMKKHRSLDETRARAAVEVLFRIRRKRKLANISQVTMDAIQEWRALRVKMNAHIRHPLLVAWAFMRSRYAKPILKELMRDPGGAGRDCSRRTAAAVVMRWLLEDTGLTFKRAFDDFAVDNPIAAGAFRYPRMIRNDGGLISRSAVMELIKGRKTRPGQEGMLARANPAVIERQMVRAFIDLSETPLRPGDPSSGLRWPKMRTAMGLDGFYIPISAEQRQSVSKAEEVLLNGRFDLKEAALGKKGDKKCRGFIALVLTPLCGPVSTAYIHLIPANEIEPNFIEQVLQGYAKHAGDAFHDLEYLALDRLYMDDGTCKTLTLKYGIKFVIPWREDRGGKWADNCGTPYCELHGRRTNMAYLGAPGFRTPPERLALGLAPGDSLEDLVKAKKIRKKDLPHVEYACPVPGCKSRVTLYAHDEHLAILASWVPYMDVHNPSNGLRRFSIREELQPQRNSSESMNAVLQRRGLGLVGEGCPRGIKTLHEMRWYAAGRAIGHTYKRLAQVNGALDRAHQEADELGFLKPKGRRWLRKARRAL